MEVSRYIRAHENQVAVRAHAMLTARVPLQCTVVGAKLTCYRLHRLRPSQQITLVQEGSVVRAITRLDELCREVRETFRALRVG